MGRKGAGEGPKKTRGADADLPEAERLRAEVHRLEKALAEERARLGKAQVDLHEALERYTDLYHFAPIAYLTLDGSALILEANLPCAQLLGVSRRHMVGMPLSAWVDPTQRRRLQEHIRQCQREPGPVRTELRLRTRRGVSELAELVTQRFTAMRRRSDHYRTAIISLAEREQAAREREQLLVEKRSAELANDAKLRFLAMLSHELRTPLTPILLAAEELEHANADARGEMVDIIRRNAKFEAHLIDDLLDATRIQHDKLRMDAAPVNLHEMIERVLSSFARQAAQQGVRLTRCLEGENTCVEGDAIRLQQVFANVVENGLKHTAAGGRVDVRTEDTPEGVRALVADTGRGMTTEELGQLFRPFEQPHLPEDQSRKGLGLGLAIAKGLVEGHGGSIEARSEGLERGTVIEVRLPARRPGADEAPVAKPRALTPAPSPPPAVLVVEDHPDTAHLLEHLLRKAGYRVRTARSCREAREAMNDQVDLIVSDIGLPDGNALELLPVLRETRDVPAVAMTGYGAQEDVAATRRAGFETHLTKPAGIQRLQDALFEARRRHREKRE
ncbi:MAG: ATP-binding protein [Myxococcota bacterium]